MKLEQNDKTFLFSHTEIPDIFFTEYLSQASGESLKVYLYLLFLGKYNKEVKLNDLSKKLGVSLKSIQESLKYWEDQEVITKKSTGYILNDIQEKELHHLYHPKLSSSPEEAFKKSQNQYRSKAIEEINNSCFQGMMSPSWYHDIDLWFSKYNFDEQVMITLFKYCLDRSALHRNYIQTVAESWSRNQIRTYTDLDIYYEKQEKLNVIKKSVSKKLGFSRPLTQYETAYIEKWVVDFGFAFDIIEIALKRTTSKANPNFDYLDKLLTDWHDRGLKTSIEIQNFISSMKKKDSNIKDLKKQSTFNNYNQRNYDDLNSLYANKQN